MWPSLTLSLQKLLVGALVLKAQKLGTGIPRTHMLRLQGLFQSESNVFTVFMGLNVFSLTEMHEI
jgi:hypothetical protein